MRSRREHWSLKVLSFLAKRLGAFFSGVLIALAGLRLLRYARQWLDTVTPRGRLSFPHAPPPETSPAPAALPAEAVKIAIDNLISGLEIRRLANGREALVLCAGRRNFREPWARDLSFASFGLVELGAFPAVRQSLELFLRYQRRSGQFPIKLHSTSVPERYLNSLLQREQPNQAPLRPRYLSGHNTVSLDGNALLVIAMLHYAHHAGDKRFLHAKWPALRRATGWLENFRAGPDGLLVQAPYADWADSIARQGRVLYSNVVFWKALHDMADAALWLGQPAAQERYQLRAAQMKTALQTHFWRPGLGYFITSQEFDNLSASGNLLAVAWGLATTQQANQILDTMERFGMADPLPTQVVHPAYPRRYVALENRLGRLSGYHIEAAWLWLGAWHVIAALRTGRLAEATTLLERMSAAVVRDGVVNEVYTHHGRPVSGFWYTSEAPFTWSAGMLVYAYAVYSRALLNRSSSLLEV